MVDIFMHLPKSQFVQLLLNVVQNMQETNNHTNKTKTKKKQKRLGDNIAFESKKTREHFGEGKPYLSLEYFVHHLGLLGLKQGQTELGEERAWRVYKPLPNERHQCGVVCFGESTGES